MSERQPRILVVGVARNLQESISEYLHKWEYHADSVENTDEAWLKPSGEKEPYDVILITESSVAEAHANIAPMRSELISRIPPGYPNTVCIFLTESRTAQVVEILQTDVYRYRVTPSNLDELGLMVCMAIEQSRLRREKDRLYEVLQRNHEELKQVKGLVGARTALAWMGMASSTWRHTIDKHALTIQVQVQLLRRDLGPILSSSLSTKVNDRLVTIERLLRQILEKPITPPLSAETGVEPVSVSVLVEERAKQLWQNDSYKRAELRLDLHLSDSVTVRASPEWLRRAFDILVDNAIDAIADCETRVVAIGTRATREEVEIRVSDTGPGISEEISSRIGLERIEKPQDTQGLGMGLLMAQAIAQTYGGEIHVESTGPSGTTMVISLPIYSLVPPEKGAS